MTQARLVTLPAVMASDGRTVIILTRYGRMIGCVEAEEVLGPLSLEKAIERREWSRTISRLVKRANFYPSIIRRGAGLDGRWKQKLVTIVHLWNDRRTNDAAGPPCTGRSSSTWDKAMEACLNRLAVRARRGGDPWEAFVDSVTRNNRRRAVERKGL